MLNNVSDDINENMMLGISSNLLFDTSLKNQGKSLILKRKYLTKLFEIKETLDLRNIWRVRNPKSKHFIFHQKHGSGLIQRRLD